MKRILLLLSAAALISCTTESETEYIQKNPEPEFLAGIKNKKEFFFKVVNDPVGNGFKLDSTDSFNRFYSKIDRNPKKSIALIIPLKYSAKNSYKNKSTPGAMYWIDSQEYTGWFGHGMPYPGGSRDIIWADIDNGLEIHGGVFIYNPGQAGYSADKIWGTGLFSPDGLGYLDCDDYITDTPSGDLQHFHF
ncbi:hypothetical protein ACM46_11885 [Chryseobacterium angstadtii]|uniref:Lipoprotein n=1 Tax=Chryseobacterium angstadtii TaxID=558151 RepID=A0A0J7IFK4_9FLAO|nr:hypothetical protein [Chryseobacterium angstadtii]KMQ64902.1 hypothetical protein ACM46_11885 [Chryseobacterium angstadtii]